jgi:hypothetical protein
MKAKPGSRVAIAALDKGVLLLRDAKQVTKEEVCGEILIISVHYIIEISGEEHDESLLSSINTCSICPSKFQAVESICVIFR